MGRPENPINRDLKRNARLAAFLRMRRSRVNATYADLAELSEYSRQTLQRAASGGSTVPPWPVVESFVNASHSSSDTGADLARSIRHAKNLWRKARYEQRQMTRPPRADAPVLGLVRDEADVAAVLVELYEQAGAPSMKEMEERAAGNGRLPHSTAHRIVTRKALPYSFDQFDAFLIACEVPVQRREPWHNMWIRMFGPPRRSIRTLLENAAKAMDESVRAEPFRTSLETAMTSLLAV